MCSMMTRDRHPLANELAIGERNLSVGRVLVKKRWTSPICSAMKQKRRMLLKCDATTRVEGGQLVKVMCKKNISMWPMAMRWNWSCNLCQRWRCVLVKFGGSVITRQPSSKGGGWCTFKKINGVPMQRWKKDVCINMLCMDTERGDSLKCGSLGISDTRRRKKW